MRMQADLVSNQGTHRIETSLSHFGDTCGVLPVGQPAKVSTNGLKWDIGPDSGGHGANVTRLNCTVDQLTIRNRLLPYVCRRMRLHIESSATKGRHNRD